MYKSKTQEIKTKLNNEQLSTSIQSSISELKYEFKSEKAAVKCWP